MKKRVLPIELLCLADYHGESDYERGFKRWIHINS